MSKISSTLERGQLTREALEARALQRARDEHIHIFQVPGRPGFYRTRSRSNPHERHSLVAGPDGIVGCSCSGFYYRESCKHVEQLKNRLAREEIETRRRRRYGESASHPA
jgi:hypothetical protein